jgi:glycosyltransferase involved in cell wall biosynthesis
MAPFLRGLARALIVTRRMDYRPNRLFAPYLYNRAVDGVAAISMGVADALKDAGVASDHLRIIPSGVDCDHFRPADSTERENARARIGIGPDDFAIGSVGMLEERKGHRHLLEAIAELKRTRVDPPRIKCVIAGDGSLRATLAKLAVDMEISDETFFPGMVPDARAALDALDLFVFPSLKEGLGVALLEAMACGLPAIASRTGGVIDIINDDVNGVLVPPGNSNSIVGAVASLTTNNAHRSALGEAARRRVMENFSIATMTRKTIDLYRACLVRREVKS